MAKRIAVVVSQGQSNNPAKRSLEEDLVAQLMMESGIDVTVIPNLYDLRADGTGVLALHGIKGNMVLLSWLFPRAAHWILDRNGIHGHVGETLLTSEEDDDEADEADEAGDEDHRQRVVESRDIPNRKIYCLDLKSENTAQPYLDEVKRIAGESATQVVDLLGWVNGTPKPDALSRFVSPTNDTALDGGGNGHGNGNGGLEPSSPPSGEPTRVTDTGGRRWYPVIDFSRCTNCMECIDFCLFGVYGVDHAETILVEQPDNCRKGCPACSRVCPENAIIFPQHKTPGIAGADDGAGSLKIDLSQLFGAPTEDKSIDVAVRERDEQLMLAGRDTVGSSVGIPKRQDGKIDGPKDELDSLIDQLDELDI